MTEYTLKSRTGQDRELVLDALDEMESHGLTVAKKTSNAWLISGEYSVLGLMSLSTHAAWRTLFAALSWSEETPYGEHRHEVVFKL